MNYAEHLTKRLIPKQDHLCQFKTQMSSKIGVNSIWTAAKYKNVTDLQEKLQKQCFKKWKYKMQE